MYDSEINVQIQSFWDAEWRVAVMVSDKWVFDFDVVSIDEIIPELQSLIKKYLPESHYAKNSV